MTLGPGFVVTGLTAGATYTGVIAVWSSADAPNVRASIDGTLYGPLVASKGAATARVAFVATATSHTLTLEPVGIEPGQAYGDTWASGYLMTAGNYAGDYFPDELYDPSPVTVYDHEARQGEATDYIVADPNGAQLASTRMTVPAWGTWLKSPGRPYLNVRCYLENEGPVKRAARRLVVDVQNGERVVLSQRRTAASGSIRLLALEGPQATAVDRLLDDGATLMLDTHPEWGVPYRYISVGDETRSRPYGDTLGLDKAPRLFELADVVAVAMPTGVTVVDPKRTHVVVPSLYGSYAALAASVPTYEALATGEGA